MSDNDGNAASGGAVLFIIMLLINMILFCYDSAIQNYNNLDELENETYSKRKVSCYLKVYTEPLKFSNTFQLIITSIHLLFGSMYLDSWVRFFALKLFFLKEHGLLVFEQLGSNVINFLAIFISIILMLIIILITGIMIPKCIGKKYANHFLKFCYPIIWFFMFILTPITTLVRLISRLFLKIFRMENFEKFSGITEKGIISMVNEGQEMGVLEQSEAEMITNIFEYGDKDADDIMIRRKNIVAIESSMKMNDAIDFIANENYSRIPVYTESIDNIIGILHLKDLMRFYKNIEFHNKSLIEIDSLIRAVQFIPETRKIDAVFKMMQLTKEQMVIVIDEYGQTSGLIAMEDILEEIVGNIMDEYDEEEDFVAKYTEDEFIVSGKTRLEDLEEKLNVDFDEEDFDTLNGYIISKLDRIPNEDEEFSFVLDQYIFKINHVENKMIHSVLIKSINSSENLENIKIEREG